MKIGIDISQVAYENTGVSNFIKKLVKTLIENDEKNEYVLFGSSLRLKANLVKFTSQFENKKNVKTRFYSIPPTLLDLIWNRLHVLSIEKLIGDVDIFITSDWTQPPTKSAKKASILYDLIVYKFPEEAHSKTEVSLKNFIISPNIVETQKRANKRLVKEADLVFAISQSTKNDAIKILGISPDKIKVIYPGFSL